MIKRQTVDSTLVPDTYLVNTATTINTIPANSTNSPIEVSIYVYYEGEDANCKSSNITASLDTLALEVVFGTTELSESTGA